jgi:hypothetical protein
MHFQVATLVGTASAECPTATATIKRVEAVETFEER